MTPRTSGSSPLTRGKPGTHARCGRDRGLIPAHAGKTARRLSRRCWPAAHPRSRGENPARPPTAPRARGSSPLTRGKRVSRRVRAYADGLIPAHAGKTVTYGTGMEHPRAHPRSRGENRAEAGISTSIWGSSPLTRGKRVLEVRRAGAVGLIPAHAGKTFSTGWRAALSWAHPRSRGENLFHFRIT